MFLGTSELPAGAHGETACVIPVGIAGCNTDHRFQAEHACQAMRHFAELHRHVDAGISAAKSVLD